MTFMFHTMEGNKWVQMQYRQLLLFLFSLDKCTKSQQFESLGNYVHF